MAPSPSTTRAEADSWAVDRAVSLLEVWALVAAFSGLVGAWQLLGVCRAARAGAKEFLGTLPRLVVCGGYSSVGTPRQRTVSAVWGLDLATMRWEAMPALLRARERPACCAVRGALVVLGGLTPSTTSPDPRQLQRYYRSSRVEILSKGGGAFVELPPLSCGAICGAVVIAVDESHSALGQVLLLGGKRTSHVGMYTSILSAQLVDLATGVCTLQADLLHTPKLLAAVRLPDGGIACIGGADIEGLSTWDRWGRPVQGALDAAWTWRRMPAMSIWRDGCSGCVLSDGRFAVLGGYSTGRAFTSSCEALTLGGDEHWSPLPSMHDSRVICACVTVAGCIIVAGGLPQRESAEVFDEVLGRWLRLPHDLSLNGGVEITGGALL